MTKSEKQVLEMWTVWVDGRRDASDDDSDDPTPAELLLYLSSLDLSESVVQTMRDIAREYGYVMPDAC